VDPRLVGAVYVVYFVIAFSGETLHNAALKLAGTAWYFVLAVSLYVLLRPSEPGIAWALLPFAALGCVIQGVAIVEKSRVIQLRSIAVFGLYLVVLGYLVARSTLLPGQLGIALAVGGIACSALVIPRLPTAAAIVAFLLAALSEGALAVSLFLAP